MREADFWIRGLQVGIRALGFTSPFTFFEAHGCEAAPAEAALGLLNKGGSNGKD